MNRAVFFIPAMLVFAQSQAMAKCKTIDWASPYVSATFSDQNAESMKEFYDQVPLFVRAKVHKPAQVFMAFLTVKQRAQRYGPVHDEATAKKIALEYFIQKVSPSGAGRVAARRPRGHKIAWSVENRLRTGLGHGEFRNR
jgi:hypothetical protein